MKKPGLAVKHTLIMATMSMLVAASGAASAAQWARVASGGGSTSYIDKASVIKTDRTRKVWSMKSFTKSQTTPEGRPYRSVKALHLYTCEERTTVLLSQVFYAEAMGKGEPLENYKYEKFTPEDIVPDSPSDHALGVVCKP